MSRKNESAAKYAEKLKEYAEKLNFSTYFSTCATLSLEEHKMLVEGYKDSKFHESKEFVEFERADLFDYMLLERRHGRKDL